MKTNRLLSGLLSVTLVSALIFTGCKKDKNELSEQEEQQVAMAATESEGEADNSFSDVFDDAMGANNQVGMEGTGIFGGRTISTETGRTMQVDSVPSCATVTIQHLASTFFPVKVTVDFGAGCIGRDGRTRSGKMITIYTGRLTVAGSMSTTTFDNYRVDSVLVQGTVKITNTSTPPSVGTLPVHQFTVDVINGRRTRPNGHYLEWNGHRVITQVEGMLTPLHPFDDVYAITGHGSGSVHRGTFIASWESQITVPLRKRFNCRWITQGKIRVVRRNLATTSRWAAVLDYGAGTCDRNATLTINGVTHNILLR